MGENIYTKAYELLSSGQKIVLTRTIRKSGSAPRDVGSMCIITQEKQLFGTVGGGALEYRVQKRAIDLLKQAKSYIYRFRLTNEDVAGDGMICGGDVDLYMEPLFPENSGTVSLFKAVSHHLTENKPGILVTRVDNGINAMDTGARVFMSTDGKIFGTIPGVNVMGINIDKKISCELISLPNKSADLFVERIALNPEVFLFGAGHVSMVVAQLAAMVGFDVTLIDDRSEFASKERFPHANRIIVTDFNTAFEQLNISQSSYILIITRGHLHDKKVLEQALSTSASYIGMIGSIKKRNLIYKDLMDHGASKESLEKVYSPIGLSINAETPEEIAISIVGELIKKRAPEKKRKNIIT